MRGCRRSGWGDRLCRRGYPYSGWQHGGYPGRQAPRDPGTVDAGREDPGMAGGTVDPGMIGGTVDPGMAGGVKDGWRKSRGSVKAGVA